MFLSQKKSWYPVLVLMLILVSGCSLKSWQPQWSANLVSEPSEASISLLQAARDKYRTAGSREMVMDAMDSYRAVLQLEPGNKEALTDLANLHILMGTAYTVGRREKAAHFHQAMGYCERAMYTNPAFREEVDKGKKPWEAATTLQAEDAPAMFFWVTAMQYEFKETMPLLDKIANVRWMQHGLVFLDRITEVSPDFGNGAVEFAYTICYCVLPESFGGDESRCHLYMDKAIERSDGYLLARWGRGKYFYQISGDTSTSKKDLEWILRQDIDDFKDVYPWRVHFMKDAATQLRLLD